MSKRIKINDLNVYYGKFKAVEGVGLTVEPRTVTAFIGPSGCAACGVWPSRAPARPATGSPPPWSPAPS